MNRCLRRNKKGISTVIATIIIVAIAIVMAIAVAYWALGIGGSFTRFEKLQFVNAYALNDTTIMLTLKNTGTAPATINQAMINGQPLVAGDKLSLNATSLKPGDYAKGNITFGSTKASGLTVEVKIQTAAGNEYPQVVVLP
jgi:FlaG/FlaF family flagellin (archaellin)